MIRDPISWRMPQPVLQAVAVAIAVLSVGSFVAGVATAPARSRLPGERLDGVTGQPVQAQEATPLTEERIQGAAPAVELSDEEKARLAEEKEAKEAAEALAKAEGAPGVITPGAAAPAAASPAEPAPAAAPPPAAKVEEPPF